MTLFKRNQRQPETVIRQVLAQLSAEEREIVRLKFQEGYTYYQIRSQTGRSLTEIAQIIFATIRKISAVKDNPNSEDVDSEALDLTSYALNELDELSRGAVEYRLKFDTEARNLVLEVLQMATLIRQQFIIQGSQALLDQQKAQIAVRTFKNSRGLRGVVLITTSAATLMAASCMLIPKQTAQPPAHSGPALTEAPAESKPLYHAAQVRANEVDEKTVNRAKSPSSAVLPSTLTPRSTALSAEMTSQRMGRQDYGTLPYGNGGAKKLAKLKAEGGRKDELYQAWGESVQADSEQREFNTEAYDRIHDNPFMSCQENPLSTFSIDVDTASYSNVRRFLSSNMLPPKDAVRIEELVNYFNYRYEPPKGGGPFSVHLESSRSPWSNDHRLVRIALKGQEMAKTKRPASNLVFLVDTSGSMQDPNKLPLLQQAFRLLTNNLTANDSVSMVAYAGSAGLVLPATNGKDKATILAAIDRLQAGGSTNGGQGIQLAYKVAKENFIKGGVNRVILATDGDFNVGVTNRGDLTREIESAAKSGTYLSILGFGMGNYKDATMEELSNKGNGNYAYIDSEREAQKVLVEQMSGTLVTIAKDVKIQVEFNPRFVSSYRLIGYENRMLRKEDFNDDKKDAGEIGAGHTVTALYEIIPAGKEDPTKRTVDPLKYQKPVAIAKESDEFLTVKLRYKRPDGDQSQLLEVPLKDNDVEFTKATEDFRFASSVALFGMLLRESEHKGQGAWADVVRMAEAAKGTDSEGYRAEFIELAKKARDLQAPKEVSKVKSSPCDNCGG